MLFETLRKRFNKKKLRQQPKPIKRAPICLNQSKSVGLIFDVSCENKSKTVLNFAEKLRQIGKEVHLFGVNTKKKAFDNMSFPVLANNNITWAGVPNGKFVNDFLSKSYDVLFVVDTATNLVYEYLSTLAHANLKVGPATTDLRSFDVMIEVAKDYPMPIFVDLLEMYSNMINRKLVADRLVVAA